MCLITIISIIQNNKALINFKLSQVLKGIKQGEGGKSAEALRGVGLKRACRSREWCEGGRALGVEL